MDDHLRVWLGPRLRLLVRVARNAPVRRFAPAHVAPGIQRRSRTRATSGIGAPDSHPRPSFSLRRRRTHGDHYSFGYHRAHSLALDAGARRAPAPVPLRIAGVQRRISGELIVVADVDRRGSGI